MRFDEGLSLREARRRFFEATGYNETQYADRVVKLRFGQLPFCFPNTRSRQRAIPYHDLHHVLTGYGSDWRGEAEISAWELASGCRDFGAAWVLNSLGLLMGLLIAPVRTLRAFLRGRSSSNLYGEEFNHRLLDEQVGTLRRRLHLSG